MTIEKQHHFTGVEIVCITGITEKDFSININLKDLSAYLDLALTQKYASNITTLQTSRIQIVRQAEPSADWSLVRPSSSPLLKGIEALEQHPDLRGEDPVIGLLDTIDDQARKVGIDGVLETAHDGVEERGGGRRGVSGVARRILQGCGGAPALAPRRGTAPAIVEVGRGRLERPERRNGGVRRVNLHGSPQGGALGVLDGDGVVPAARGGSSSFRPARQPARGGRRWLRSARQRWMDWDWIQWGSLLQHREEPVQRRSGPNPPDQRPDDGPGRGLHGPPHGQRRASLTRSLWLRRWHDQAGDELAPAVGPVSAPDQGGLDLGERGSRSRPDRRRRR